MACSSVKVMSWMHLRTESGNTLHLAIVSALAVHSVPTFGQFLCFSLPVCTPHDKSISMMVVFHQLLQHPKRLHWQLPCGRDHNASCTCNQKKHLAQIIPKDYTTSWNTALTVCTILQCCIWIRHVLKQPSNYNHTNTAHWTKSYSSSSVAMQSNADLRLLNPMPYRGRTAPLTSEVAFYIFIQQTQVLNILNMVYTLHFFLFKMQFVS